MVMQTHPLVKYIIPIYNNTKLPTALPQVKFINDTKVTHRRGGHIHLQHTRRPSCGWGPFIELMQNALP